MYASLYYVSVIMGPAYNKIISRSAFSIVNAVADMLLAVAVYPNLVCYSWALVKRQRIDVNVKDPDSIERLKSMLHTRS